jgi:hypothetical protein
MMPLQIIERELRKFGTLAVRIRQPDSMIPRLTFLCWNPDYPVQVGHGDTLEEAYAMMLDKLDALDVRLAA